MQTPEIKQQLVETNYEMTVIWLFVICPVGDHKIMSPSRKRKRILQKYNLLLT